MVLLHLCLISIVVFAINGDKASDLVNNLPGLRETLSFKQYSGYLDGGEGRNLHYWLVESEASPATDPLVLWLNGGPGCSSLTGLLEENGPVWVDEDGKHLVRNHYSWNKLANVLYLVSPAGVGFSYTYSKNYTTNDNMTMEQNYLALKSFFKTFPEFEGRDFYITGESYAGVYIPMLAARVLQDPTIKLKGYAIGNGMLHQDLLDSSLIYYEYYHGILGNKQWGALLDACCAGRGVARCMFSRHARTDARCGELVTQALDLAWAGGVNVYGMYAECDGGAPAAATAAKVLKAAAGSGKRRPLPNPGLMSDLVTQRKLIMQTLATSTAEGSTEEVAYTPCSLSDHVEKYLSDPQVQSALHVSAAGVSRYTGCSDAVSATYVKQVFDLTSYVNKALDQGVRVLIYNGDTDMACNFLGDEWFVEGLGRPQLSDYQAWHSTDATGVPQVAGYSRQFQGISFVTIKGAGHFVPTDKPKEALEMFQRFLTNTRF